MRWIDKSSRLGVRHRAEKSSRTRKQKFDDILIAMMTRTLTIGPRTDPLPASSIPTITSSLLLADSGISDNNRGPCPATLALAGRAPVNNALRTAFVSALLAIGAPYFEENKGFCSQEYKESARSLAFSADIRLSLFVMVESLKSMMD